MSQKFWTWRKGRSLLQFDSENTMNHFRPSAPDSWWRHGGQQLYIFLAPKLPNVDFVKDKDIQSMKNVEKEGVGALDMSKDKKQAFKGAHWTVKFDEQKITKGDLRGIIKELVSEMWADIGTSDMEDPEGKGEGELKTTGRLTAAGADAPFVDLYKGDKKGHPDSLPSVGGAISEESEYEKMVSNYKGEKCPKCSKFHHSGKGTMKVLNPSNPMIHQCGSCGHKWNPDNFTSTVTKVGDKSVLGAKHHPLAEFLDDDGSAEDLSQQDKVPVGVNVYNCSENKRTLFEAKGMNTKDKLKSIILEAIGEMGHEQEEKREVQIAKDILKTIEGYLKHDLHPYHEQGVQIIKRLSKELIDIHTKEASLQKQDSLKRSLQYKHGRPVDGMKEERTSLGVTQETISKTQGVLEQMLAEKKRRK